MSFSNWFSNRIEKIKESTIKIINGDDDDDEIGGNNGDGGVNDLYDPDTSTRNTFGNKYQSSSSSSTSTLSSIKRSFSFGSNNGSSNGGGGTGDGYGDDSDDVNQKDGAKKSNSQRLNQLIVANLSIEAKKMLDDAIEPFVRTPNGCIVDHLVNLYGIGQDTNCMVTKEIGDSFKHPIKYLKYKAYTSACLIDDQLQWDRQYVNRVVQIARDLKSNYPFGKSILSAMDKRYHYSGEPLDKLTGLYVPNDYLLDIVHDFPEYFVPCISIHPYRKDAIDELLRYVVKGIRYIRWYPVSMGINMDSEICDPFYEALVENDLILFVHLGTEHSLVEAPESDSLLGNPLLLKRPLDKGVKIVGIHCGGDGKSFDYEDTSKLPHPQIPNLHLFLRLMHEPKYENNLIGDLGGIVAFGRVDSLVPLLDHKNIHDRLIFSSDYPTPAVNLAVITTLLANRGLITPDEREFVNEIYKFNPILFDFVLKRILKSPVTGNSFNVSVFKENKFFEEREKDLMSPTTPMTQTPVQNDQYNNHNSNIFSSHPIRYSNHSGSNGGLMDNDEEDILAYESDSDLTPNISTPNTTTAFNTISTTTTNNSNNNGYENNNNNHINGFNVAKRQFNYIQPHLKGNFGEDDEEQNDNDLEEYTDF